MAHYFIFCYRIDSKVQNKNRELFEFFGPCLLCLFKSRRKSCWFMQGVNFTHILRWLFSTNVSRNAFLYLKLRFVLFWSKNIGAKAARNMLVKLTPGMFVSLHRKVHYVDKNDHWIFDSVNHSLKVNHRRIMKILQFFMILGIFISSVKTQTFNRMFKQGSAFTQSWKTTQSNITNAK